MHRRRTAVAAVASAVALLAVVAPGARAEPHRILTAAYEFVPPEVTIGVGDTLDYTNIDVAPHNVVAKKTGRNGEPLFASKTVSVGTTVPVKGVEKLGPGAYPFVCTLHPGMVGTLFVEK